MVLEVVTRLVSWFIKFVPTAMRFWSKVSMLEGNLVGREYSAVSTKRGSR